MSLRWTVVLIVALLLAVLTVGLLLLAAAAAHETDSDQDTAVIFVTLFHTTTPYTEVRTRTSTQMSRASSRKEVALSMSR